MKWHAVTDWTCLLVSFEPTIMAGTSCTQDRHCHGPYVVSPRTYKYSSERFLLGPGLSSTSPRTRSQGGTLASQAISSYLSALRVLRVLSVLQLPTITRRRSEYFPACGKRPFRLQPPIVAITFQLSHTQATKTYLSAVRVISAPMATHHGAPSASTPVVSSPTASYSWPSFHVRGK